jgi:hypothetical protein
MEIILAISKYLISVLSPIEFLAVTALIAITCFMAVKWSLKRKAAIMALFTSKDKEEESSLVRVHNRLDIVATKEDLSNLSQKLELIISHEISENTKSLDDFKHKFVEISSLRQEMLSSEFDTIKNLLEVNSGQNTIILTTVKDVHSSQVRLNDQVEHFNEFLKDAILELRGYHRDLSSDIKVLSRDIALMERSVQLSINTQNTGIKLR